MADKTLDRLIALAIQGGTPTSEDDPLLVALRGQQTPVTGDIPVPPATAIPGGPGLSEEQERNIRLAGEEISAVSGGDPAAITPDAISGAGNVPVEAGEGELGEEAELGFDPGLIHQLPDPGDGKDVGVPAEGVPGAVGSALVSGGLIGGRERSEKLNQQAQSIAALDLVPETGLNTAPDLNQVFRGDLLAQRTAQIAEEEAQKESTAVLLEQNKQVAEFRAQQDAILERRQDEFRVKQAEREREIEARIQELDHDITDFRENGTTRFMNSGGLARKFGLVASVIFGKIGGSDTALNLVENMIKQDLEVQSQALGKQQNLLSFMQKRYGNSAVAFNQAQAALRDDMIQRIETRIMATQDPVLQAKGRQTQAALKAKNAESRIKLGLEVQKGLQAQDQLKLQRDIDRRRGGTKVKGAKPRPLEVKDVDGTFIGFAGTAKEAARINTNIRSTNSIARMIGRLKFLVGKAQERSGGRVIGSLGQNFTDDDQAEIDSIRDQLAIFLTRESSGLTATDKEFQRFRNLVPGDINAFSFKTFAGNVRRLDNFFQPRFKTFREDLQQGLVKAKPGQVTTESIDPLTTPTGRVRPGPAGRIESAVRGFGDAEPPAKTSSDDVFQAAEEARLRRTPGQKGQTVKRLPGTSGALSSVIESDADRARKSAKARKKLTGAQERTAKEWVEALKNGTSVEKQRAIDEIAGMGKVAQDPTLRAKEANIPEFARVFEKVTGKKLKASDFDNPIAVETERTVDIAKSIARSRGSDLVTLVKEADRDIRAAEAKKAADKKKKAKEDAKKKREQKKNRSSRLKKAANQ